MENLQASGMEYGLVCQLGGQLVNPEGGNKGLLEKAGKPF